MAPEWGCGYFENEIHLSIESSINFLSFDVQTITVSERILLQEQF